MCDLDTVNGILHITGLPVFFKIAIFNRPIQKYKQRRKGKIYPFECKDQKNSKER